MRGSNVLKLGALGLACFLWAMPASSEPEGRATRAGEIGYDASALPSGAQRMRERIMEAARTGDIETFRPIIEMSEMPPIFFFGGADDPIAEWRAISGDGEGREILAIMLDLLEAGYVRLDSDTAQEIYVWPYFYAADLQALTPEQEVELYRLVSPEQHRDMIDFGGYHYYRLGIGADGTWHFFVAGD